MLHAVHISVAQYCRLDKIDTLFIHEEKHTHSSSVEIKQGRLMTLVQSRARAN